MSSVYSIFDFFKEAFHLNRNNKVLFRPQIVLIALKSVIVLLAGLIIYFIVGKGGSEQELSNYFGSDAGVLFLTAVGIGGILTLIVFAIISLIVETGLYNMYKSCVNFGEVRSGDFWEGARKYFFKFLIGNILIVLAWIVFAIPYIIMGIVTLSIAFSLVPLLINIFLTMWKVSVVMNDTGVIEAFKDSFRFAKKNFYQLALLQIINWSFTQPVSGGGSGNFNRLSDIKDIMNKDQNNYTPPNKYDTNPYYRNQSFGDDNQSPLGNSDSSSPFGNGDVVNPFDKGKNGNPFDTGNDLSPFGNIPNQEQIADSVMKGIKIGIAVLIPVLTIATAVGAAIKAVFEIFFSLALFVAYKSEVRDENEPKREVFF